MISLCDSPGCYRHRARNAGESRCCLSLFGVLVQASLKTEKQAKKDRAFPMRKFAIKA